MAGALAGLVGINEISGVGKLALDFVAAPVNRHRPFADGAQPPGRHRAFAALLFGVLYQGGVEASFELQRLLARDGGHGQGLIAAVLGRWRWSALPLLHGCMQGGPPWMSFFLGPCWPRCCASACRCCCAMMAGCCPSARAWWIWGWRAKMLFAAFAAGGGGGRHAESTAWGRFAAAIGCLPCLAAASASPPSLLHRGDQIVSGGGYQHDCRGLTVVLGILVPAGRADADAGAQRCGSALLPTFSEPRAAKWFRVGGRPRIAQPQRSCTSPSRLSRRWFFLEGHRRACAERGRETRRWLMPQASRCRVCATRRF